MKYICERRNGSVPCFLPPHLNHQHIETSSQLPLNNRLIDTLTLCFLPSNIPRHDRPFANAFTNISPSADTTWSRPRDLQHRQSMMMMMNLASPVSSPASNMSLPSYTRSRNASHAGRPQRPSGSTQPPQPRDGDTRHMFNSMSASFASRGLLAQRDPQPRDPGNGRHRRDPQPRDGGKRDPQPRDPGT